MDKEGEDEVYFGVDYSEYAKRVPDTGGLTKRRGTLKIAELPEGASSIKKLIHKGDFMWITCEKGEKFRLNPSTKQLVRANLRMVHAAH